MILLGFPFLNFFSFRYLPTHSKPGPNPAMHEDEMQERRLLCSLCLVAPTAAYCELFAYSARGIAGS